MSKPGPLPCDSEQRRSRLALLSLGFIAGGQVVDGVDRTDRPSERDREQRHRNQ